MRSHRASHNQGLRTQPGLQLLNVARNRTTLHSNKVFPLFHHGQAYQSTRCLAKRGDVLVIADDLAKTYDGEKTLFTSLTFSVVAGDKLAIIGPNGSGKSSLLKLLAGRDTHDTGQLIRNKGVNVGYLSQDPVLAEHATVLQAVLSSDSMVARAVQEYQTALKASELGGGVITKDLEVAIEKMNTYNAWEVDAEAKRVLEAVGISESMFNQKVSSLSGGQRKRVALAASLLGQPDLLILDEPTNHMDVEMIAWMERELKREELAVVLVSHDRYFMEAVCDRMLELDNGKCFMHNFGGPGSYEQFKQARSFRRAAQANAAADARTLFRREAEWIVKQPKARGTKSQARVKAFYDLTERVKDVPQADLRVDLGNAAMVRQGNKVIKCHKVCYEVGGRQIIKDFTYEFLPGSRLGIVGRNGAGKSTLLNLIAGTIQPSTGDREIGETSVVGYFTQYPPPVHEDLRVIDYIREIADDRKARNAGMEVVVDTPEVLLEKLGFARPRQFQRVGALSGGERRRLHLASVLVARPNVLILDEPTNDLDLSTVEVVEQYVAAYKGVVLVVSHDRAFMDNVVDRLLVLKGDGLVRLFEGSYTEYLEIIAEEQAEAAALAALELEETAQKSAATSASSSQAATTGSPHSNGSTSNVSKGKQKGGSSGGGSGKKGSTEATAGSGGTAVAAPPKKARKLGYYEEQEYKKLCAAMDKLNAQRDALQKQVMELAQSGSDLAALEKASVEMGRVTDEIDNMSERWLELAELAGDL